MSFKPSHRCPKCDSEKVSCRGKRHAVYPAGCLWAGLTLGSIHQLSGPMLYQCADCGHDFGRRTLMGKVGLGLLIFLLLVFVGLVVLATSTV